MIAADLHYWKIGDQIEICFDIPKVYTVYDTGSAIKGKYRFDILVADQEIAIKFGVQQLDITKVN